MQDGGLTYEDGKRYPYWTTVLGNMMSASVLLGIFGWAFCTLIDALFIHKRV